MCACLTNIEAEDEDAPLDFDKTISDEIDYGTMEVKRDFLNRFLVRKQVELSEIMSSRRTRSYVRNEVGNYLKYVKFKEKTYQITEYDGAEDVISETLEENVLIAAISEEKPLWFSTRWMALGHLGQFSIYSPTFHSTFPPHFYLLP